MSTCTESTYLLLYALKKYSARDKITLRYFQKEITASNCANNALLQLSRVQSWMHRCNSGSILGFSPGSILGAVMGSILASPRHSYI
jgi:hypothetical protein